MKKTLVLGASANPNRYSSIAIRRLLESGHPVVAMGNRPGIVHGTEVLTSPTPIEGVDTITLYINPAIQQQYYSYLIGLKPNRIIFNPGTENPEFERLAGEAGIHCENACTLVLLSTDQY
jgi:predicted CoA-binding protein